MPPVRIPGFNNQTSNRTWVLPEQNMSQHEELKSTYYSYHIQDNDSGGDASKSLPSKVYLDWAHAKLKLSLRFPCTYIARKTSHSSRTHAHLCVQSLEQACHEDVVV